MASLKPLSILYFSRARSDLMWMAALVLALLLLRIPLSNFPLLASADEFSNRIEDVLYSLLPLLGFVYGLKWFAGFQDGDVAVGKQSCIPGFLLYSPLTTVKLAVIPTVGGLVAVALSRFISAPDLISNEGLIAILSSSAVYFWLQAILWQSFPIRFIRGPLIVAIIAIAYVVNIYYRNLATTNINTTLAIGLLMIAVLGVVASFFAIKNARRGVTFSLPKFFFSGNTGLASNALRGSDSKVSDLGDYKSAFDAQIKYERGLSGYFLPTVFPLVLLIPFFMLFLGWNDSSARQELFGLYLTSLFIIPIVVLYFIGLDRGILVTNRDFQCDNFSDVLAILPMSSYRLLNAKYSEMSFSSLLVYGVYFIFCSLCFQKYSIYFIDLILEPRSSFAGYSLIASVVFCSLSVGTLAYMSLPWFGSILRKYQDANKTKVVVIGLSVIFVASMKFVVGPYIKNFTAEDIPDVKMAVFILSALKILAVLWSISQFKKLYIPLRTLTLFVFAWVATIAGLVYVVIQFFPLAWQDVYFIVSLVFLFTPILGILFTYIVFTKSRYR